MGYPRCGHQSKEGKSAAATNKEASGTGSIFVKPEPQNKPARGVAKPRPGLDGTEEKPFATHSSGEEGHQPAFPSSPALSTSLGMEYQARTYAREHKASTPHGPGPDQEQQVHGHATKSPPHDSPAGEPTQHPNSVLTVAAAAPGPDATPDITPAGTPPVKPSSTPGSELFESTGSIYSTSLSGPAFQTPSNSSTFEDIMSSGVYASPSKKRKVTPLSATEFCDSLKVSKLKISRLESHGNLIKNVMESTLDLLAHTSNDYVVDNDEYRGVLYPLATHMLMAIEKKREVLYHSRIRVEGDK